VIVTGRSMAVRQPVNGKGWQTVAIDLPRLLTSPEFHSPPREEYPVP
jgi:hypothetical protein